MAFWLEQNSSDLKCFDRHLIYPIVDFAQTIGAYTKSEMLSAKYELLEATKMPSHCADLYKQIHNVSEAPATFDEKQKLVDQQLEELESRSQKVLEVLENPEVASALRQDKAQNLVFLRDSHGISSDDINVLYTLGQFDYNRGNYAGAIDHLYHFRVLSTDQQLVTSATWGLLACEILTANWEDASSELTKLKEQVDAYSENPRKQLRNRTCLLHWSLFPFHKADAYKASDLQDLFFTPAYLNAMQVTAPHLLRYLTIAVLTTNFGPSANGSNRRLKDLVRLLEAEQGVKDPITEFARTVFSKYDFAATIGMYEQVRTEVEQDYFLSSMTDDIMKSLRIAVAESYLRLHRTTEIAKLADTVALSNEELSQLVSQDLQHLDADIDTEDGTIEVMREQSSTLQDLVNKTKALAQRSTVAQGLVLRARA